MAQSFSADEVLARITPRTRLIIVNSPANPTGGVMARGELERLVEGLARHPDIFVLSDEIYARLVFGAARHASLLTAAVPARPADRPRRPVQDLRDDRLAARLGHLARRARRGRDPARRQHLLVRQRGRPARRHRRAHRPARRRRGTWSSHLLPSAAT